MQKQLQNHLKSTFMFSPNAESNHNPSSTKGVDYTRLRDFLRAEEWEKADKETSALLIVHLAGQAARGYLKIEDVRRLSQHDIRIIDQLWMRYSNGRFGLNVQKKIFEDVDWCPNKFAKRVGWGGSPLFVYESAKRQVDLNRKGINFSTTSPTISLPFPGLTYLTILKFGSKETAVGHLPYYWLSLVEPEIQSSIFKLSRAYLKMFNSHFTPVDIKEIFSSLNI